MHTNPGVSNPRKLSQIPDDAISEGETRPNWSIVIMCKGTALVSQMVTYLICDLRKEFFKRVQARFR